MNLYGVTIAATDTAVGYDLIMHLQKLNFLYDAHGNLKQECNFRMETHNGIRQYSVLLEKRDSAHELFENLTKNKRFKTLEILLYQTPTPKEEILIT